jgi:hypothetical protein
MLQRCSYCSRYGATINCRYPQCNKIYHYPCASGGGCFQVNIQYNIVKTLRSCNLEGRLLKIFCLFFLWVQNIGLGCWILLGVNSRIWYYLILCSGGFFVHDFSDATLKGSIWHNIVLWFKISRKNGFKIINAWC